MIAAACSRGHESRDHILKWIGNSSPTTKTKLSLHVYMSDVLEVIAVIRRTAKIKMNANADIYAMLCLL
jgi:hypothetical protein